MSLTDCLKQCLVFDLPTSLSAVSNCVKSSNLHHDDAAACVGMDTNANVAVGCCVIVAANPFMRVAVQVMSKHALSKHAAIALFGCLTAVIG
jgi:hypothetical protein